MKIPLTPIRFLERAERLYGGKVAVVCGVERFTYAQLAERSRRLAGGLRALGLRAGERVAFLGWNCHRLLEAYYGVPMAGGVLLPLNVRLSAAELAAILRDADARVLFYDAEFAALADSFHGEVPELEHYIPLTKLPPEQCAAETFPCSYDQLVKLAAPLAVDFTQVDEDSIAEMFYTSGTTGNPKGVTLSHRTLYLHALNALIAKHYTDAMVQIHAVPLYHANGWGNAHMLTAAGARQVILSKFDAGEVCRLIEREKVTALCMVPTMAVMLLEHLESGGQRYDLSSMQWTELGGAAATPELMERLERAFGCLSYCGYGLTESGPVLSISRLGELASGLSREEQFARRAMTGREIVGAELRVVDEHGCDVPRDGATMGEVIARGDGVMDGYWENPADTAAALRGGWLHTGDMAVWDEHGFIRIVDRKKEIIISGGENISSLEIERVINAHPAVQESAVVPLPDAKWGEVPRAFVVLKAGATLGEPELLLYLSQQLARFKLPRQIVFASSLPKGGTGKILKKVLRQQIGEN
jgi:fatty-acyl-CoA synthase